jgi:cyclopropane fatty-acyl-phospholipid synthase-like methyltransferase
LNWWDLAYISGFTPWDTASPPAELEDLLERGLLKPCRALDIGCGTGGLVVYLAKRGFEVTGVDISIIAVKRARARAVREGVKASFIKMDLTDVGQAQLLGKFDLVTDVGCYHSLSQDDRRAYIESLNTVIKAGVSILYGHSRKDFGVPLVLMSMRLTGILGKGLK